MARLNEPITVSKVLDSRPRIFSLPTTIVIPAMFIVVGTGSTAYLLGLSGTMTLLWVVTFLGIYFFLFGQESWRLMAKLRKPPSWVRSDVSAIPFTLDRYRYEKTVQKRKYSNPWRKRAAQPH
ncbi:MAG: hypothetical protein AAF703_22185 [Cyanobacteria bacterium P01_D01_bin.105]